MTTEFRLCTINLVSEHQRVRLLPKAVKCLKS